MKPRPFDYVRPDTVDEAVALLAEHGDDARMLAGGQSLMAMLNLRAGRSRRADRHRADSPSSTASAIVGDKIEVGAAVTQNKLMAWPELAQKLPLLAAALPFVGHFQTRNKGTVCGSIAHADPSSEIPLSLAMLEGEVVLRSHARHARARRRRFPARHADDRARAGRTDHRGALSGRWPRGVGVPRGGAPAWRFRHRRGRRRGRRAPTASGSASAAWRTGRWCAASRRTARPARDAIERLACGARRLRGPARLGRACGATSCATSRPS